MDPDGFAFGENVVLARDFGDGAIAVFETGVDVDAVAEEERALDRAAAAGGRRRAGSREMRVDSGRTPAFPNQLMAPRKPATKAVAGRR